MVKVTRLNGGEICVNAELLETVESTPDTILTLTTGRKMIVRESLDEIIRRVIDYKRSAAMKVTVIERGPAPAEPPVMNG